MLHGYQPRHTQYIAPLCLLGLLALLLRVMSCYESTFVSTNLHRQQAAWACTRPGAVLLLCPVTHTLPPRALRSGQNLKTPDLLYSHSVLHTLMLHICGSGIQG